MSKFSHICEPYGRIDLVETRLVNTVGGLKVVGTVESSPWCGALLCGVPMVETREKLEKGSSYECRVDMADWKRGYRRDIAM
jgi:hypothetical protein